VIIKKSEMTIEDLSQLEILQGSTSLIYAVIGKIVGAIIASKYYTYKKPELLGLLPTIFIVIAIIVILITMSIFIRQSLKNENLRIKWKGRFLLIAVILLLIGSLMDTTITLTATTLIIARLILIWRLIFSYLGWLMPEKFANWLIIDKE